MASKWVEHVKQFAEEKEMKYGEAMKNEECKRLYQEKKASIKTEDIKEMTRPKTPKPDASLEGTKKPKSKTKKSVNDNKEREPEPMPEPMPEPVKKTKSKKTKSI